MGLINSQNNKKSKDVYNAGTIVYSPSEIIIRNSTKKLKKIVKIAS